MKKRLEAELISIAHRVLKLKNKSEVNQLYLETQKLYETLSVLKFYGDHIEHVKATISEAELEEKLEESLENNSVPSPPVQNEKAAEIVEEDFNVSEQVEQKQLVTAEEESEVTQTKVVAVDQEEPTLEEDPIIVGEIAIDEDEEVTAEETGFDPIFEMASEKIEEETAAKSSEDAPKAKTQQISFQDLLGENYKEPEFVKSNNSITPLPSQVKEEEQTEVIVASSNSEQEKQKPSILNDKLASGINIGLNDRIGFVKYLFDNSTEDYNRVLSQLNTFDTFSDAKNFIEEMVKPDYNNWVGQEDFAERFMEIVEKKFG